MPIAQWDISNGQNKTQFYHQLHATESSLAGAVEVYEEIVIGVEKKSHL